VIEGTKKDGVCIRWCFGEWVELFVCVCSRWCFGEWVEFYLCVVGVDGALGQGENFYQGRGILLGQRDFISLFLYHFILVIIQGVVVNLQEIESTHASQKLATIPRLYHTYPFLLNK